MTTIFSKDECENTVNATVGSVNRWHCGYLQLVLFHVIRFALELQVQEKEQAGKRAVMDLKIKLDLGNITLYI